MVSPHSGFLKERIGLRVETELQDILALGSLRGQSEAWIKVLEHLIATVNRIQSGLCPPLKKGNTVRNAARVKKIGRESLKFLAKKPQYLKKDLKSGFIRVDTDYYRPALLIDPKPEKDYDTLENRFLRGILTRIRQAVCLKKGSLRELGRAYDPNLRKRLENLEGQLDCCLKANFWTDVSEIRQMSVNQVLQMSPSYQDIYRCYLVLIKC
ncbi:hypothetical protein JCM17380_08720 [Desulfosporosinus burensis]